MLKLTCRDGEIILFNNDQIEIKVVYVQKSVVCLGIQAPRHIDVDRKEIFLRKKMDRLFADYENSLTEFKEA